MRGDCVNCPRTGVRVSRDGWCETCLAAEVCCWNDTEQWRNRCGCGHRAADALIDLRRGA